MSGDQIIRVGDVAPDFELDASDGRQYHLRSVLEHGHVTLVFYPGNNTPG